MGNWIGGLLNIKIINRPDFIGGLICLCIPFLPVILSFPVQPHFPIKATLLAP